MVPQTQCSPSRLGRGVALAGPDCYRFMMNLRVLSSVLIVCATTACSDVTPMRGPRGEPVVAIICRDPTATSAECQARAARGCPDGHGYVVRDRYRAGGLPRPEQRHALAGPLNVALIQCAGPAEPPLPLPPGQPDLPRGVPAELSAADNSAIMRGLEARLGAGGFAAGEPIAALHADGTATVCGRVALRPPAPTTAAATYLGVLGTAAEPTAGRTTRQFRVAVLGRDEATRRVVADLCRRSGIPLIL